jgi:ABC-type bacteriocin/lantibiotic exporter with double-glycine peptidase domain
MAAEGINALAPYFLKDIGNPGVVENSASLLNFFGLSMVADGTRTKIDLAKQDVLMQLDLEVNKRLSASLFFQEFEFIHDKSLGEIYTNLERGKTAVRNLVNETISEVVPVIFGGAASLAAITKINPILGGIGLTGIPLIAYMAKKQNREISAIYNREMEEQEGANAAIGAVKSGFEEVRTSPNMENIAEETKGHMDTLDKSRYERRKKEIISNYKRMIPFDVSTLVAIGAGAALQSKGLIPPGAILSNVVYSSKLSQPVQKVVDINYNRFPRYIQDVERMNKLLGKYDRFDLPEGEKEMERIPVSELENFDIVVKNLSYNKVLKDVELIIKEGEFVSISGASGAGKSTLLRNLIGLYKPSAGEVELGGCNIEDIKKYGPESIYSAMSYCNQSPQIFPDKSVRDNLLLWSGQDKDEEEINTVLRRLRLDKFVGHLDDKLKYASGGEKVRIGLARTILKGAKIMLLDEPTASLDSRAQKEVLELIADIRKNYPERTIVCVSHDRKLIEMGDREVNIGKE